LTQTRHIHIALTFSDSYWALAYAVMRSICLSTTRRADLVFHLCHEDLAGDHRAALEAITAEFGAALRHHDLRHNAAFRALVAGLPTSRRFPSIVYARLLLDRLLPPEAGRVVYLDCDTLVRRPIEELYEIDLCGHPLAAVADPYHDGIKRGRDIRDKPSPFDTAEPYFNSGVLLVDIGGLAAADIPARLREMEASGILSTLFFDQDVLNYVFRGRWLALDWRFNVLMPKPAHEALNPRILHYTMDRKPWNLFSGVAFARTYRHVMTNAVFYRYLRERWRKALLGPLARRSA